MAKPISAPVGASDEPTVKSELGYSGEQGTIGHNSGDAGDLPEEALFISHLNKIRQQAKKAEAKKAEYDAEKKAVTALFRQAKADGFNRKELQVILDDSGASRRDLEREEARRAQLRAWAGLPTGVQGDLFATTPQAAIDELDAEGRGYTAGLRGDDPDLPDGLSPHLSPAFLRGWGAGQDKLAWALAKAANRPAPSDEDDDEGDGIPETDDDLDEAAAKLRAEGWTETTGEPVTAEAA